MTLRKAGLAGSWYPAGRKELAAEVERCLRAAEAEYGAGEGEGVAVAAVAPHAGLAFSGPVAAAAYRAFCGADGGIDTFVLFGACHRERLSRPAVWTAGAWETPLGPIQVDEELARLFVERGVGAGNGQPHYGDNAIELQTPFIKYLFPDAKIVPVALSPFPDAGRAGELASRIAMELGGRTVAVGSTDLTHYGKAFGVAPAGKGEGAIRWVRENDRRFLAALIAMDAEEAVRAAERDGSACGAGAAAAVVGWARDRGGSGGRVLAHTNSYEVMPQGEAEHVVGYASVLFEA